MSRGDRESIVSDLTAIAAGFVLRASLIAEAEEFPEIFFLTREGELFLGIFEALRAAGVLPTRARGLLFETSRQATYCASLRDVSIDELMRLWRQYKRQSPAAFLTSLGEAPPQYGDLLARHGLVADETIEAPWTDLRMQALVADAEFVERIQAASRRQREVLLGYIARLGMVGRSRVLMTDIGWRGTIQDNLCLVLPECRITGVYVGLQRFLNPQPPNAEKRVLTGDMNDVRCSPRTATALKFVTALEMLCGSKHGTVLGYGPGPELQALREADSPEAATWAAFTGPIQAEVLARAPDFARKALAEPPEWIESTATRALERLLLSPRPELAAAFVRFVHDERFGGGAWDAKGRTLGRGAWRAAFDRTERAELGDFLRNTSWPQGWLKASGMGALVPPFNLLLRRQVTAKDLGAPVEDTTPGQRLLHITGRSDHGGGPEHVLQLLMGAPPDAASFVACPEDGVYWTRYRDIVGGCRVLAIPHRSFRPAALRLLAAFVRRNGIRVIHAHGIAAGVYGRLASAMTGVPCVYTPHGVPTAPLLRQELYRFSEPALAHWTAAVIAVSAGERDLILRRYPVYRGRVHLVPNGIGVPLALAARPRKPSGAPAQIISFSRANRQKNPELLVSIARRLAELHGNDIRVDMYGEGLAAIDAERGHPPRNDPGALLAAADFYLSTSRWEGMPMSILEAWRAGTCVVATDVVGNRDLVVTGRNGVLYPSEDAEAGARALLDLMAHPDKVETLRQQAFADCAQSHSREAMVRRLGEVYASVQRPFSETRASR